MYEVLKFDWDDDDEIREIVKRWAYLSLKQDKLLEECADYFYTCKAIYDHPIPMNFEQTKVIGKLLLNGLTNISKINEPMITSSGNYEITSTSSVTCYLCIDKDTGNYKYNLYTACE